MDKVFNEVNRINELIKKSGKSVQKAILKLVEETGELVSSTEALSSYKNGSIEHVQEEVVDVLQCAISLYCLVQKESPFDGEKIMKQKNDKWESKYLK